MKESLFRKSSVERVSSPEQLNDYIKIANPSVWIVIGAIIVLLAAGMVWAIFGTIKTKIPVYGYAENGVIACYLADVSEIKTGMAAATETAEYKITFIADKPAALSEVAAAYADDYVLHMLAPGEWSYRVEIAATGIADGLVKLDIVKESVTPMSFIFN